MLLGCHDSSDTKSAPSIIHAPILSIDLEQVISGDSLAHQMITIPNDAFFHTAKTYRAVPLESLIQQYFLSQLEDTTDAILVFECKDGYKPTLPLSVALNHKGYIALKDSDAPIHQPWADSLASKFHPFYLVWQSDNEYLVWPYGLYKISLQTFEQQYAAALPAKSMYKGFELFKKNCMKCHSINKVGGNLGPEFNHPKNITEYWRKEDIWQFIQQPQAYRYNSQMPPQTQLSAAQFNEIYAYLKGMQGRKIE